MEKKFFGAAEEMRIKLNDMINAGTPPIEIVLEFAKILGEVSGESSYYREIFEQATAVYGLALHEKKSLDLQLEEVKKRLEKIKAASENPDFTEEEHKRMGYALERHRKEIEMLEKLKSGGDT